MENKNMYPYVTDIFLTDSDKNVPISFPVKVIDMIKIGIDNIKRFNAMHGVYILVTDSGKRYIGTTTGFYSKLRYHKILKEHKVKFLILFQTEDDHDANILNAWLISKLGPELNSKHPDLDRLIAIKYANISFPQEVIHNELKVNFGIKDSSYILVKNPEDSNIETIEDLLYFIKQEEFREYLTNFG